MATKKTTTKKSATAKASKPAAKKAAAPKKATAKKPAAKAVKKPAADGVAGDAHEKVQLWKDGPYWATTNIGAEKPEDLGYYFWWGDAIGYKREKDKWAAVDGSSTDFSFEEGNTPTYGGEDDYDDDGPFLEHGGWITDEANLVPEHDAAHVHWGRGWWMPSEEEMHDLVDKCVWTWENVNGVNGYVVRGKGDYASASIFLPSAGYAYDNSIYDVGSAGSYWSHLARLGNAHNSSWALDFDSGRYNMGCIDRDNGLPVRPVWYPTM